MTEKEQIQMNGGSDGAAAILEDLTRLIGGALHRDPESIDLGVHFAELGADSILLLDAQRILQQRYGVKVTMQELFKDAKNLHGLAEMIVARGGAAVAPELAPATEDVLVTATVPENGLPLPALAEGFAEASGQSAQGIEAILAHQLATFERLSAWQLAALGAPITGVEPTGTEAASVLANGSSAPARDIAISSNSPGAIALPRLEPKSEQQKQLQDEFLQEFTARYTRRTRGSKELAQAHRDVSADIRVARNFRLPLKELVYPIAASRSRGSRFWDVDGNEYVDLAMGFGTNLFGHGAPFVQEAIQEQVEKGLHVGPQSERAGAVARLIGELTGLDRVSFSVSGTEANMVALRLARAITGRPKIVIFNDSYHGHYDGTLAIPSGEGAGRAMPMIRGVPEAVGNDTLVMDYGDPASLDVIRAHGSELAAVLVEPVQSRRPGFLPVEFVRELRDITRDAGTALIFDEVLTGFRLHPAGAQARLGVKPDLATYGKVLAAGLPIGVVAGSAEYLDALDGGYWRFGDDSIPSTPMTFGAGTYIKHPLSMAVAQVVLERLKREGPAFQDRLNERTAHLVHELGNILEREGAPLRIEHCGSMFRFLYEENMDLFFYSLIEKGVYLWEQRICFLSEAHEDRDDRHVVESVMASVAELQSAGFFPARRSPSSPVQSAASDTDVLPTRLPLTATQQQLYFLSVLDEYAAAAYNEAALLRITGSFDVEGFRRAGQMLVARHQALRVAVPPDGTCQEIHAHVQLTIPLTDLSEVSEAEREDAIRERLATVAEEVFDLEKPPLLRVHLIRRSPDEHLLLLVFHPLAIDGISLGVIIGELAQLYLAESGGTETSLPEPLQLEDYVRWTESQRGGEGFASAERYWLDRLSGRSAPVELPLDRQRPAVPSYAGGRVHEWIPASVQEGLREIASAQRATFFATVFTAFSAFLHRLTGQDELVVGVRVADRNLEGAHTLVANTTNLLPILSDASGDPSFVELLDQLQDACFEAFEHQSYPFALLVSRLNPERDPTRPALCNLVINLDRNRSFSMDGGLGLGVELVDYPLERGCLDLDVNLTEVNGQLRLDFEYSADLFEEATVRRWLERFLDVLRFVVAKPACRLSELAIASDEERSLLLGDWNATDRPYPHDENLVELFRQQARKSPEAEAVSFAQESLRYAELDRWSGALASRLVELGVGPEVPVGLLLPRSPALFAGLLGILGAGAAFVPLDPSWPDERLSYVVRNAGIRVVVGDRTSEIEDVVWVSPDEVGAAAAESWPDVQAEPSSLAYAIYTSGSTGAPKAALLQHDGMLNHLFAKVDVLELSSEDVIAQTASQCFDISIWQYLAPLLVGGRVHVVSDEVVKDPEALLQEVEATGVTVLETVPSMLRMLVAELQASRSAPELQALRWLIATGETLPADLAQSWLKSLPSARLLNAYGPTECSDDVTHFAVGEEFCENGSRVPIGRPIGNIKAFVLDRRMSLAPIGTPGELCISGVGVGRGYLNDPDGTLRAFVPAPPEISPLANRLYRTGDCVRMRDSGLIDFLGRNDEQVKVRGFRVEPSEIEMTLRGHPGVRDSVVAVQPTSMGQSSLVGYVVPEEGTRVDISELRSALARWLPDFMVPSSLIELDAIPLTGNGKVDKRALPLPSERDALAEHDYTAPRNDGEKTLAEVWAEVLGLERVGIQDNFFELGGDSILALAVVNRARAHGLRIKPLHLFLHQTISELACAADAGRKAESSAETEAGGEAPRRRDLPGGLEIRELDRLTSLMDATNDPTGQGS